MKVYLFVFALPGPLISTSRPSRNIAILSYSPSFWKKTTSFSKLFDISCTNTMNTLDMWQLN